MFAPAGQTTARAGLRSKLAALVVRRQAPPNPRRGGNGCSVGAAYMPPAAYRGHPSTGKGEGCRPPLPLSSATHLWQSVGAGHARPAALLCHPFAFCIVGRGLDPSAASRRREPQSPSGHRCRSATSPVRGGFSRGLRPRKRPPCQRGLSPLGDWGIPTGLAKLPVTPADGRESLRLACARHLPLTREASPAGSARAKGSPHRGAGRVSRPEGLCRAFRPRPVTPLPPDPPLTPLSSLSSLLTPHSSLHPAPSFPQTLQTLHSLHKTCPLFAKPLPRLYRTMVETGAKPRYN